MGFSLLRFFAEVFRADNAKVMKSSKCLGNLERVLRLPSRDNNYVFPVSIKSMFFRNNGCYS